MVAPVKALVIDQLMPVPGRALHLTREYVLWTVRSTGPRGPADRVDFLAVGLVAHLVRASRLGRAPVRSRD